MTAPIIPGAEPWSADGGPHGALVLHGFTGNPTSMRGIADALHQAGFAVEMPLLPGHGTAVADMIDTTFPDWLAEAQAALGRLQERLPEGGRMVVVGLSMGGGLATWVASDHPGLAGLACINPVVSAPEGSIDVIRELVEAGQEVIDGIGSDIADPDTVESAYLETPLRPMLSLLEAADEMPARLARIACPVLIITSRQDHVVPPENSDILADAVAGPVERVFLERSYHVATLDYDKDEVVQRIVEFAAKVVADA